MIEFQLYRNYSDCRKVWEEHERTSINRYIFQTYAWQKTWFDTIGREENIEPLIVEVRDGDRPLLLLPLGLSHEHGLRSVVWLGGTVTDYLGALIQEGFEGSPGHSLEKIWRSVLRILPGFDRLFLFNQPQNYRNTANPFVRAFSGSSPYAAHWIDLEPDWETYYRGIKDKIRSDSDRQLRRLEKLGKVDFGHAGTLPEKLGILERMIALKAQQYERTGNVNMFSKPRYREFYRNFTEKNGDQVVASEMRVGTERVAVHWGLLYDNRLYYMMPAYDFEWNKFSPGRLLLAYEIRESFKRGNREFDLTWGDEPYKFDWRNNSMPMHVYDFRRRTLKQRIRGAFGRLSRIFRQCTVV